MALQFPKIYDHEILTTSRDYYSNGNLTGEHQISITSQQPIKVQRLGDIFAKQACMPLDQ
jgi:hypothetical protein